MSELPDCLKGGEEARLIPTAASTHREHFACSVLLASLRVVQPFARAFFDHLDWKVGSWAKIYGYTEPVFRRQPEGMNCRPDGLLVLNTGKRERRLIVEAKIGSAKIDADQLAEYYRLAKANKVDAIITVSNELSADPTHLPYQVPKEIRHIPVFHWSWSYLVMLAELLLREEEDFDEEQGYILKEIIRYFDSETAGTSCNTTMCADWPAVVGRIQESSCLKASEPSVLSVVRCWHQQLGGMCIGLTRQMSSSVTLSLSKTHWDQNTWFEADVSEFVESNLLRASFKFSDPAGPIEIVADAKRRNITYCLQIDAPLKPKTYRARVKWLLNQLPEETSLPARLDLIWDGNKRSSAPISNFREDLDAARIDGLLGPRAFEIVYVADLASKFAGRQTFIPAVDEALAAFRETIARHIRPWQPPAEDAEAAVQPDENFDGHAMATEPRIRVAKRGQVNGRAYSIFADGSIEIETGNGVQRFNSFAELTAAAAAKNGHADRGRTGRRGPDFGSLVFRREKINWRVERPPRASLQFSSPTYPRLSRLH